MDETGPLKHTVVIVGGGTAGITVAAQLRRARRDLDIAIVEPSEVHYYQPLWTLVGGGVLPPEQTRRPEMGLIPPGVEWIRDQVVTFDPDAQSVGLASAKTVSYEWLVVAVGIQIDWHGVEGLAETIGQNGVCSNYSYDTVGYTWQCIRSFEGGNAVFTQPSTPIKCGGAPQKICYLAEDYFRRKSRVRDRARVIFAAPGREIFGIERYAKPLRRRLERGGIETLFGHDLVRIKGPDRVATFRNVSTDEQVDLDFTMLHVAPPQSAPDVLKSSPLGNDDGWVEVDKHTLQHVRWPRVFSLGDASSLPTSKTGAAVRKQAPVLVQNLLSAMDGQPLSATYNGYTSCPVVTGYGSLVLAEFNYDGEPDESFPINQGKERWSMYMMKRHLLPRIYWHGMLRGRM